MFQLYGLYTRSGSLQAADCMRTKHCSCSETSIYLSLRNDLLFISFSAASPKLDAPSGAPWPIIWLHAIIWHKALFFQKTSLKMSCFCTNTQPFRTCGRRFFFCLRKKIVTGAPWDSSESCSFDCSVSPGNQAERMIVWNDAWKGVSWKRLTDCCSINRKSNAIQAQECKCTMLQIEKVLLNVSFRNFDVCFRLLRQTASLRPTWPLPAGGPRATLKCVSNFYTMLVVDLFQSNCGGDKTHLFPEQKIKNEPENRWGMTLRLVTQRREWWSQEV